jgi:hypothetical protein
MEMHVPNGYMVMSVGRVEQVVSAVSYEADATA